MTAVPLTRWVRENESYSIAFSEPTYCFVAGALYERAGFQREVEIVRRAMRVEQALSAATTEKGRPAVNATSFPVGSIFNAVETDIYPNNQWLCCVDLGDEWADYLCIDNDNLIFVHCKNGKESTSATAFHEVIGQALTNLSRAQSTPAEFSRKIDATRQTNYWAGTKVRRFAQARRPLAALPACDNGPNQHADRRSRSPYRSDHALQTRLRASGSQSSAALHSAHMVIVCIPELVQRNGGLARANLQTVAATVNTRFMHLS